MMKDMIQRIWKKLCNRETIMYLICGVATTLVNQITFMVLNYLNVNYIVAASAAWVAAVLFAYIVNKLFVFQSKSWKKDVLIPEFTAFIACRIISFLFDLGFMVAAVEFFKMNEDLAKLASNVFVVIANYFASKLIIFRKKD